MSRSTIKHSIYRPRFRVALSLVSLTSLLVGMSSISAGAQSAPVIAAYTLEPHGYTMLASPKGIIRAYRLPNVPTKKFVHPYYFGSPVTMPVISVSGSFLLVRLPTRPNGSTTWVKKQDVNVSASPYRIMIYLRTTHLEILYKGKKFFRAPIGIGISNDPTPKGRFFVAFYAQSPNAGYGPFVVVTSAHSNKITDWEQSGDALIAIHGPLGADHRIGTNGARISHGCIRLHVGDLRRLGYISIGSPVQVV